MGRKSNTKGHISSPLPKNHTNDDNNINDLYCKRLRSWKQTSTQLKSNHTSNSSSITNDELISHHKSTIYTYPINLSNVHQSIVSNTVLSESLTTESAFYCPSTSYTSIQTIGDLNNNHVTTLNIKNQKRKNSTLSCESLSSQISQIKTFEMSSNPNNEKNISNTNYLQLTHHQSSKKRSRLSTIDSIITNDRSLNSPLFINDNTIDINQLDQQELVSSSINNESLINKSNSMEAAVKMVEPIVDIIFNAFEDQLKNVQIKTMQSSSLSTNSSISPLTKTSPHQSYPSTTISYLPLIPPARPVVLHAVNFNIQLTTKQPIINPTFNENDHLQSISMTELKQKIMSCILPNNLVTDHEMNDSNQRKRRKLKRFVQLAVFGVSVLCGYLLL